MELWGGLECTIARVGDDRRDQVAETGHRDRPGDLDLVASLGIRTLRYPVLWEGVRPSLGERPAWGWHDQRLRRLRELAIRPVAGLIHHGSGPLGTDLLDPAFPDLLAQHAAAVARRYPWIDLYVPVNEPLTTARFSGLYGHWHPHRRDDRAFLRALVNQCRATVLSMRAIRRVSPGARLVQTEDLGRIFSTPRLGDQASYENERRWLTFDLLFGRVDRHHPWHAILRGHGIGERELAAFEDRDVVPDVVGINHYLTSERFLDERLHRYPAHMHGGNGREPYADVEAVRVPLPPGAVGPAARLREAWSRYRAPIAITEAHHGCTRDEQLRWLLEVWRAAERVRREGADIRAVTAWALLGATDWNSLLTRRAGIYEPGAFDVRDPEPRPTALAAAVASLARAGRYDHPVLDGPGWWKRPARFYGGGSNRPERRSADARLLLLRDAGSPFGRAIAAAAAHRGLALRVADPRDDAPPDPAVWAVIDGPGATPPPGDPAPLCRASRLLVLRPGEAAPALPGLLCIRVGHLFGPAEPDGCVSDLLQAAAGRRRPPRGAVAALTYLPDLVHVALDLLIDGAGGDWPLLTVGQISRRILAAELADRLGERDVRRGRAPRLSRAATPDGPSRASRLPPLESALDRYVADLGFAWREAPAERRAAG